ncbi:hypothetical protein [Nostoc piscinale]|nr:hypothetical protein [Nostoc piscinale]
MPKVIDEEIKNLKRSLIDKTRLAFIKYFFILTNCGSMLTYSALD